MFKFLAISVGIIGVALYVFNVLDSSPKLPTIPDTLWKPNAIKDEKIYPFSISFPKQDLDYLKTRLRNTTFIPPLDGIAFQYGFNTNQLRKIVDYWANVYDWPRREKLLNSVPHFRTKISGLEIHFIRVRPTASEVEGKKILPMLLLHGWPGSIREFYDVIPLFTKSRSNYDFVFEIIVPSLPGYGFSEAATVPGMDPAQIGRMMKTLMTRLGFQKFYVQGGDWGSFIGSCMATAYPENVIGFHSNWCPGPTRPSILTLLKMFAGNYFPDRNVPVQFRDKAYNLKNWFYNLILESGYFHIQATKPDTIGVALTDSPAGLAAYILEKFSTWTNSDFRERQCGGLCLKKKSPEQKFSIDDLLDNVMIYWITKSITSSIRLYSEAYSGEQIFQQLSRIPTNVPTACTNYPHELVYTLESALREKFHNLIHFTHMPRGGHFAAFEEPELFSEDVWKAICNIENFAYNTTKHC